MTTETSPILNLLLAKGVGVKTLARIVDDLIASHLSPEECSISDLATHLHWSDGFTEKTESVQEHADKLAEELEKADIKILVRGFSPYPDKLVRTLGQDAPPVLFAKGNLEILGRKSVGFCGSRHASDKGIRVASDSAQLLGQKQIDVVSGYAKGVDLAAHCAALEAGGTTTIVLAEGILHYRPKREIKKLFTPDNHLVISEFSPRIPWAARNAMQRNETIIGLSDAMIVIESGTSGGTHACAESALRLGHPLFVAEYSSPTESAEGNRVFLDKGAQALRGDRRGQPNLSRVYESLGIVPRAEDTAEAQPSVATDANPNGAHCVQNPETAVKSHDEPVQVNRYPKRLIEVDLPIARISAHARREKSIRHGHISTLHIWWARRPLAACRAVICAALWPDPADPLCPLAFREAAVEQIQAFAGRVFPKKITEEGRMLSSAKHCSPESRGRWEAIAGGTLSLDPHNEADRFVLRMCLLDFIADFANWDNSTVPAFLETSRALTQAAHEALGGVPGTRPLVVDPFAGGGSIPLEALRVGADAFASDLNPVAVLLNKVVLEYIPKYGQRLADEVRKWGQWVKEQAEEELAEFYPKDPDGSTPIAYLWARTILSEAAGQDELPVEVPLLRSMWLCKKNRGYVALRWKRDDHENVITEQVNVTYADGSTRMVRRPLLEVFEPRSTSEVASGTVTRGAATCPVTGYTTPLKNVQSQLVVRHGGTADARLYCVVTTPEGQKGRSYRLPSEADCEAVERAIIAIRPEEAREAKIADYMPHESTTHYHSFVNRGPLYGMDSWDRYYLPRQLLALSTISKFVNEVTASPDDDQGLATGVQVCLALGIGRLADRCSSLCTWDPSPAASGILHTFARQALPFVWDFAEGAPFEPKSGGWLPTLAWITNVIERETKTAVHYQGETQQVSAHRHVLPDDSAAAVITDPPYYYSVQYADLSDFFYVWLRRALRSRHESLLRTELTPKDDEIIVQSPNHEGKADGKNNAFYEARMHLAMVEARRVLSPSGIGTVVFAHTSTSGWESLLQALISAGMTVTGSWPIDTEMATRVLAQGRSVLASSVHLVCRPRESSDGSLREEVGEWRDVLAELPQRIHDWMPRLASEGVVGADAIFACLGPALEIFSRYSRVEKASGEAVPLREYLEQVWAVVSTEALSMIFKDADAAGLEPDARLTAMWLWTLGGMETNGNGKAAAADPDGKVVASTGYTLEFDAARKIAQGLGIHLEKSDAIVEVAGDKARLLPVSERTRHLFGKDAADAAPRGRRTKKKERQRSLFEELDQLEAEADHLPGGELKPQAGETVLDRVHQSMILFAAGRGEALRRFLVDDGAGQDARFWKLAQSLSALYPRETDEKRWVDGVLARKKGLGL